MYHRRTDLDGRTEEWLRREYELLDHALAVAPDDPLVVAYNAWELFEGKRDLESAATEFERAVRLAPNDVELLRATGAFARQIGQFEPAIKLFKRAFRLNPLCVTCSYLLANTYYRAQRFDEALEWQEKFMQAGEGGGYSLGRLRLFRGEPQAALAAFEGDRTSPDLVNAGRAMALFDLGRVEEAQKALAEQIEQWGETRPRYVALVYAWMGDVDSAIEWLYKVYGDEMKGFWRQVYNPIWRKLHGDPRWPALRERAGLSEERLSAIEFNPVLPD
jgi:tetratricopeptide (TPR) repeat protein